MDISPGLPVRVWKPRHAEHGGRGVVGFVLEDGRVVPRSEWRAGACAFSGPFAVVTEAEYQRRRREHPDGWLWPA